MEPTTLLGPIATIIGLVAKVAIDLTSFVSSTNNVPAQIEQLSQQVNTFGAVVRELQQRFEPQDHGYTSDQLSILREVTNKTLDVMRSLVVTIEKCKKSSTTFLVGRAKWKYNEYEITSYRSELASCTSILSLLTISLTEQRVARIEELLYRIVEEMRASTVPFESQALPPVYNANRPADTEHTTPIWGSQYQMPSAARQSSVSLVANPVQDFLKLVWSGAFSYASMMEKRLFGDQSYSMPCPGTISIKSNYEHGIVAICLVSESSYVELHACKAATSPTWGRHELNELKSTVGGIINESGCIDCWVRATNGRKTHLRIYLTDQKSGTNHARSENHYGWREPADDVGQYRRDFIRTIRKEWEAMERYSNHQTAQKKGLIKVLI